MQSEKVLDFLKKKGTLGVCTLGLVGAMAFASYKTSYPVNNGDENVTIGESTDQEMKVQEDKAVAGQNVIAKDISFQEDDTEEKLINEEMASLGDSKKDSDSETKTIENEMETSDLVEKEIDTGLDDENLEVAEIAQANSMNIQAEIQPTVYFQEDSSLTWPAAGTILMDYNMNGTVYFKTLNQYKYNPALILGSDVGNPVVASARGIVDSIKADEETGTTLTMNIGNDYSLVYGQLKDITVSEGEVVEQGQVLGFVNDPTKYYCEEGANLYFEVKKNGQPVDPMLYLES